MSGARVHGGTGVLFAVWLAASSAFAQPVAAVRLKPERAARFASLRVVRAQDVSRVMLGLAVEPSPADGVLQRAQRVLLELAGSLSIGECLYLALGPINASRREGLLVGVNVHQWPYFSWELYLRHAW